MNQITNVNAAALIDRADELGTAAESTVVPDLDDGRDDERDDENEIPVRETDEATEAPEEFEVDDEDAIDNDDGDDVAEDAG